MSRILQATALSSSLEGAKKQAKTYLLTSARRRDVEIDEDQITYDVNLRTKGSGYKAVATAPIKTDTEGAKSEL